MAAWHTSKRHTDAFSPQSWFSYSPCIRLCSRASSVLHGAHDKGDQIQSASRRFRLQDIATSPGHMQSAPAAAPRTLIASASAPLPVSSCMKHVTEVMLHLPECFLAAEGQSKLLTNAASSRCLSSYSPRIRLCSLASSVLHDAHDKGDQIQSALRRFWPQGIAINPGHMQPAPAAAPRTPIVFTSALVPATSCMAQMTKAWLDLTQPMKLCCLAAGHEGKPWTQAVSLYSCSSCDTSACVPSPAAP